MIAVSGSLTELESIAARDPKAGRERAGREFEAMIMASMLKAGSKPTFGENPLDGGSAGRMAREQLFAQLAIEATRGAGLGLAEQLEPRSHERVETKAGES